MKSVKLTIGKLAQHCDVKADTLRYYERMGLLYPNNRTGTGYRVYDQKAIARVRFIKNAQSLGFSLKEIEQLLQYDGSRDASAADIFNLTEKKILEQEKKIRDLIEIKNVLKKLSIECSGIGTIEECPILKYLYPDDNALD